MARELRAARIVSSRRLGTIGGAAPDPNPDHLIIVAVIDSARTGGRGLVKHWNGLGFPTMLVVDECHWAGSEYNRGVFEGDARWRLGLSATPSAATMASMRSWLRSWGVSSTDTP